MESEFGVSPSAVEWGHTTELNAISGSAKGDTRLVYQTVAGTDQWTIYAWDDAGAAEVVPYSVDGLTGIWVGMEKLAAIGGFD